MKLSRNLQFLFLIAIGLIAIMAYIMGLKTDHTFGANALLDGNRTPRVLGSSCNASSTIKVIGKDVPTTLLATSTSRAWARLTMDAGATTSAQIAFTGGVPASTSPWNIGATLNSGISGGASSSPTIEFGLATPNPWTGTVSAFSTFGTSTILVSECWYGNDN